MVGRFGGPGGTGKLCGTPHKYLIEIKTWINKEPVKISDIRPFFSFSHGTSIGVNRGIPLFSIAPTVLKGLPLPP